MQRQAFISLCAVSIHRVSRWDFAAASPAANGSLINKSNLKPAYNHMLLSDLDFRDVTQGGTPGQKPLHEFSAGVAQVYLSIWF